MERNAARITALLPNDVLSRVERLRINSARKFTNRSRGEHLSGRGGSSTEFADYRNYTEGDDIRFIDWNIFARLQRPYMKLFRMEEEMHVVSLVDASTSMTFDGKLDLAKQLAAAFSVMGLMNSERVSTWSLNARQKQPAQLKPIRGRGRMQLTFRFIESIEGGGDLPIHEGVSAVLRQHRGRGVCLILSDFLTGGDLRGAFNRLHAAGLEPLAVQILSPAELDPDLTDDVRMVDSEGQDTLDVSAGGDVLSLYHDYRTRFQRQIEILATQRSGRYMLLRSDEPIDRVLFDTMRRKGWVV